MRFWEDLDEVVRGVPSSEKIVVAGDFNGHIEAFPGGFGDVHGGFGFGERNEEGAALLEFLRSFGLKVETKKGAYAKLVESKDDEEKGAFREEYKLARKTAKLAVTATKTAVFESLYVGLEEKGGEKSLFGLAKARD
ncbi:uncharacterized protein LOC124896626 [Capsicum annuum]|uniref:uncharacterized protein LOC124896626 n=1 Tax=Capsicum annuum TaxID=4072 RepID=UPI001FB0EB05|nr:uncharacterized protein LOC124896626 [Capsicum annuum]